MLEAPSGPKKCRGKIYVTRRDRTHDLLNMAEPNREHAKKKMS
jgi:hypothetical protein